MIVKLEGRAKPTPTEMVELAALVVADIQERARKIDKERSDSEIAAILSLADFFLCEKGT
ncbi:hypothetical protein [Citrobacter farmeri]|uniref:hypothetical protein n=1 Tax=Citrobacter farmeri TaxID=67824 RepID=UPI00292CF1F5|nr:hypothetical protein [Citrobacter farmeri]